MQYLAGTRSVHTTASICDYLDERTTPDDTVTVVATASADDPTARRDAREALNVASVRLTTVGEVTTTLREDTELAAALLEAAPAVEADEIVITTSSGDAEPSSTSESAVHALLESTSIPVVVVPVAES
ncbi:universal stress protein UspA [Haloterrigena alkaliphila]|uniref:universal stress protein UspA n=1 Tax=Haloterrigena alkaliphila TaxID=2816475 RepID=UPI001CFF7280|nr:universal stress protein UspA [Haloterrigena alkaliphila]UHQ95356.1 universal stress protein UspA [Haloterrigena alkaliphila]